MIIEPRETPATRVTGAAGVLRHALPLPSRTAVVVAAAGVALAVVDPLVPGAGGAGVLVQLAVAALLLLEYRLLLRARPGRPGGPVEVRREVERTLDLGEPAEVRLVLRNRLGLPVNVQVVENLPESLRTEEPFERTFPVRARVPARGTVEIRYRVIPEARGPAPIPGPWLRVGIVGGLSVARSRPDVRSDVRVVPALAGIVRYDTLRRSRNLAAIGIHAGAGFIRGREFDRLREYHRDDDFRDIDWKATARRDDPVTRIYRPERSQDVIVAVDASRVMTARSAGLSKLDEAVNAALVLAHVVTQGGDRFGLVVFDSEVRRWMPPASGARTVSLALDSLYGVAASPFDASFGAAFTTIASRLTRRALVVFLTDLPDRPAGDEFVRCLPLLRWRHLVACFTVADRAVEQLAEAVPGDRTALVRGLAAAELLEEKRLARRAVADGGAHCAELPPGTLAASAVNRYLDAKARGLL